MVSIPYSVEKGIIELHHYLQMKIPEVQQLSPYGLKQLVGGLIKESHSIANDLMKLQASIDDDKDNLYNVRGVALSLEAIIKKYGLSID